jgi:NADPH:quinone reductase-like Zn-dependent oxidoreductase
MRACLVTGAGALELRDVPPPEPGPGEVRVRVRAFGVNRADLLQRRGLYPAPPGAPADILGLEFAGEVDAVGEAERRNGGTADRRSDGPGPAAPPKRSSEPLRELRSAVPPFRRSAAPGWVAGDSVMGITAGGSYAEYVVVPAGHLLPIPAGLSFTDAAATPEVFVTAYDALERVGLAADEWVLIHAVGSGVGTAVLQLAQARGARCVGTSRTREKLHRAMEMGLDVGVDSTADGWVTDVRRATDGGAHAAVDLIGGPLFPRTLEALRPRGRLVLVGLTAGRTAQVDLGLVLRQRLRLEGTVLRSRTADEKSELMSRFRAAVLPLLEARSVRPVVDRVFPFTDVEGAHTVMAADRNFGKLVVEVP